jgi:hypothetical protein
MDSPALSYRLDGPILTFATNGHATAIERAKVLDAVRADRALPDGVRLLLDLRDYDDTVSLPEIRGRLATLMNHLALKLGPVCAIVLPDVSGPQATGFHHLLQGVGIQVRVFRDEPEARAWLLQSLP